MFETGSLWHKVVWATDRALACGALEPIPTSFEFVEDGGVRFLVRIVTRLAHKPRAPMESDTDSSRRPNPFLPYDPAMFVADVSQTHVALLNKFNVLEHHVLIVTRAFEHQQSPLNLADFEALWKCMAEYESLGFYNSGTAAGASQPHKHLQLVPLPLAASGPPVPIEALLRPASLPGEIAQVPVLPFAHMVAPLAPRLAERPHQAARTSFDQYRAMLDRLGFVARRQDGQDRITAPYNLLLTRQWMLLVPRIRERFHSISLNALAFAGALLVRNEEELGRLKIRGPMAALVHTAGRPRPPGGSSHGTGIGCP